MHIKKRLLPAALIVVLTFGCTLLCRETRVLFYTALAVVSAFEMDGVLREGGLSADKWLLAAYIVAHGVLCYLRLDAVWLVALAGGFFAASRYAIIDWGMFFLQVKKGYAEAGAATIVSINSVVGAVSSALSGIISDRFFKSSRKELAVAAGVLNITALALFMLVPGRHVWLDATAMVIFGFAVGILLTFLGGLMAVDYVPKCAAGAALGIAGMGNYIGAGLQSILSGYLIKRGADGSATLLGHTFAGGYTLDYLAVFWIGCAALSVILTIAAGRGRVEKEEATRHV